MIIEQSDTTVKSSRPAAIDWILAAVLALASFGLYMITVAPDVLPGDAGEFQFAAWNLGLPHPTGYPAYMIVGKLWQSLLMLAGVSPAASLNALSALFASLAVAVMYLLILAVPVRNDATRRLVAVFAALILAANATFWSQALIAEVYTLHALFLLLILYTLQRAHRLSADGSAHLDFKLVTLAAVFVGLSLTHHAMTLLAFPGILAYCWTSDSGWRRMPWRRWLAIVAALASPLVLYAYIPLRSGPAASPWLHQPWGDAALTLYDGSLSAFIAYISGSSISVGFFSLSEALAGIPMAASFWLDAFGILGLALIAIGAPTIAQYNRPFLWLTAGIAVTQQLFNLFYAIGDIAVYYIPLYIIGVIWAGYGAAALAEGLLFRSDRTALLHTKYGRQRSRAGLLIVLILLVLPLSDMITNFNRVDQSGNKAARQTWETILVALPGDEAILVSNDRDDIPPLFYMQTVEQRAPSVTALHPLMTPDERFADVGATLDAALALESGPPVFLIKAMPGLEIKYDLVGESPPLVRVTRRPESQPTTAVEQQAGPLTLLGYDWHTIQEGAIKVSLHWRVDEKLNDDYTTTVQLFDKAGNRIAQSDLPPGGAFYPTSLWRPGERLVETHTLDIEQPAPADRAVLQIGMYSRPSMDLLFTPLQLELDASFLQ